MPDTPSPSERDERLERILAAYVHAVEAGTAPDRAELLKQYPDLAADLGSFFRNRDAMEHIAQPIKEQSPALAETIGASETPNTGVGTTLRYFGDYELVKEIARGGMGVVYRAKQVSLNRIVAVKMILAGQLASEADVERFKTEAEAAAGLDHPNIVPIYEVGEHEGQHYFSMKFVEGQSLAQHLANGLPTNPEAATLLHVCAQAVYHAHERGVIHRDLKPANILLQARTKEAGPAAPLAGSGGKPALADYEPVISDFGLAKQTGRGQGLTANSHVLGTPAFMPPEQAAGAGKTIGPAADVYSLGAVLYALLTGRPPFQAGTVMDTLLQVIDQDPVPPSQLNPKTARDLETICLKCLEKRPERRYASARELAEDLERFLNYEPIHARPINLLRKAGVWFKRRPWRVTAAAVLGVLAVLGLAYGFAPKYVTATGGSRFCKLRWPGKLSAHRRRNAARKTRQAKPSRQPSRRWRFCDKRPVFAPILGYTKRPWTSGLQKESAGDELFPANRLDRKIFRLISRRPLSMARFDGVLMADGCCCEAF